MNTEAVLSDNVCLSELFPKDCRLSPFPVYCTPQVRSLISDAHQSRGVEESGIVWDIVYMSLESSSRYVPVPGTCFFNVIIEGCTRNPDWEEDGFPVYKMISQLASIPGSLESIVIISLYKTPH